MNNRNSMLYGLYTMGAKYVYIWYKERSSEEYNEWFEKFDFPNQLDILSELYPIWLDVVYKNFIKKRDDLILLCDENEVLWVAGVGLSDKIKVKELSSHNLEIKNIQEQR